MKLSNLLIGITVIVSTSIISTAAYANISVPVYLTVEQGTGKSIGNIAFSDTPQGLLITPNLTDLSPGMHGMHIHENPSCDNFGLAAGAHLDPQHTTQHQGPTGQGHLGDLPALDVNSEGKAITPITAPRLTLSDVTGHSIIIHEGGDNYSDTPDILGGGKGRIACGIIK